MVALNFADVAEVVAGPAGFAAAVASNVAGLNLAVPAVPAAPLAVVLSGAVCLVPVREGLGEKKSGQ